jgi:hypothetical protein
MDPAILAMRELFAQSVAGNRQFGPGLIVI